MNNGWDHRTGGPEQPNRGTDFDLVGRVGNLLDRYKIFWFILVAVITWWTNRIIIPLEQSAKTTAAVQLINTKIDSVIVPRLNAADIDRAKMLQIQETQTNQLGTLSRLTCLHTSLIDRAKIDINCKDIPLETPKGGL